MAVNFSNEQLSEVKKSSNQEQDSVGIIAKIDEWLLKFSKVPLKEKLFFVQHLGLMIKSGISLSIALKTLGKQTRNKYFIKILNDVARKVEEGSSFSESLDMYRNVFGDMFISMIEAGELSGKLEEVLHELFIQMKKEHALISKVKGALTYPAVILFAMTIIGIFMITVIVPKITASFVEMDAELPVATKMLIAFSNALRHHGIASAVSFVVFVFIFFKVIHTTRGRYIFHTILLAAPVFGGIIRKINLAKFARNISSLLKTDIMIVKTFQITAEVMGNVHYKAALLDMSQKIKKGEKLSEVINNYPKLFTPIVTQMVAIGEETGELDNILVELAEFYEEEVDQIMENLPSIIEPLLILFLGGGVGGVAVAIIMPMYTLTDSI